MSFRIVIPRSAPHTRVAPAFHCLLSTDLLSTHRDGRRGSVASETNQTQEARVCSHGGPIRASASSELRRLCASKSVLRLEDLERKGAPLFENVVFEDGFLRSMRRLTWARRWRA
eukprot:115100-Pyramimonas_sp.AAC.1